MDDVLIVDGLGRRFDGEYPCDIPGLLSVTSDESLTVREAHFVKQFSGMRGGEIPEAFVVGDVALRAAMAYVILRRAGKSLDEAMVWEGRISTFRFVLGQGEEEGEADPQTEGEQTETSPSKSGGESSSTDSANPEGDPVSIGRHASRKSASSEQST